MTALVMSCLVPADDCGAVAKAVEHDVWGKQCRMSQCGHEVLLGVEETLRLSTRGPTAGQVGLLLHL